MISRTHRFHGYGSLKHVYRHGAVVRGPLCAVKYAPNDRRQHYRVAVVVSKKVSKSAVVRNRIRRRVFEAVRLQSHKIKKPHDIVITVFHENMATISHEELTTLVRTQLSQAKII